jgi:hypothetical protein
MGRISGVLYFLNQEESCLSYGCAAVVVDATILEEQAVRMNSDSVNFWRIGCLFRHCNVKVTRPIRKVNAYFHRFPKKVYRNTEIRAINKTASILAFFAAGRRLCYYRPRSRCIHPDADGGL